MADTDKPNKTPQESGEKSKKEASERVTANNRAEEKLKQASKPEKQTQKKKEEPTIKKKTEKQPEKGTEDKKPEPAKPEKKEKNWRFVRGSLSAQNNDGTARTETIGLGIENKTGSKQILVGPTVTQERAPSGATIENLHPIGITGRINF